MKKLMLFIYLVIIYSLDCQDFLPSQHPFDFNNSSVYLSADSSYFKQNKFFLTWEWASGGKISKALNVYGADIDQTSEVYNLLDSSLILFRPSIYSHYPDPHLMNIRGIQYEPTLPLDPNEPEKFVKRANDNSNEVFGFRTRRGWVPTNPSDSDFKRLVIAGDSLQGQIVLEKPWPDNQLIFKKLKNNGNELTAIEDTFMCRTMYISINLRRPTYDMTDENVLKVELPYTLLSGDTGKIQFNQVPSGIQDSTVNLSNGRGKLRKLISVPPNTRSFYITKRMMSSIIPNKDITISAFFICDGNLLDPPNNPYLVFKDSASPNPITNLGIRITYLNSTCPVKIDYVRFATPHCFNVLKGDEDNNIKNEIQGILDLFSDTINLVANKGKKLFRFKLGTDFSETQNFIGIRYFSKLVGNIFTLVESFNYPLHYNAYCNPPDRSLSFYKVKP